MSIIISFLIGLAVGVVGLILVARNNVATAETLLGDNFLGNLKSILREEVREEIEKRNG